MTENADNEGTHVHYVTEDELRQWVHEGAAQLGVTIEHAIHTMAADCHTKCAFDGTAYRIDMALWLQFGEDWPTGRVTPDDVIAWVMKPPPTDGPEADG